MTKALDESIDALYKHLASLPEASIMTTARGEALNLLDTIRRQYSIEIADRTLYASRDPELQPIMRVILGECARELARINGVGDVPGIDQLPAVMKGIK